MRRFISPNQKTNTKLPRLIVNVRKLLRGLAGGLLFGAVVYSAGGSLWSVLILGVLGEGIGVVDDEPVFPASWLN
jgi:hypothetical protein